VTDTTPTPETPSSIRPRIRLAAVVWGLVLASLGAGAIWLVWSPERTRAITEWILQATPSAWGVVAIAAVLVLGLVILIGSLLGAVHRAQDRVRSRP
jgi:hypothetical protein